MRVCYFGTYRAQYARNRINKERLRFLGIDVIECHSQLWTGDQDRHNILMGGWRHISFWKRIIKTYIKLIRQYIAIKNFDIMIVGYPGHFDIFLARVLTWIRGKPLVWDFLMSLNLIAQERNVTDKRITFFLNFIENIGVKLPDMLIADTPDYSKWIQDSYGINKTKIRLLPLGADDNVFKSTYRNRNQIKNSLTVLYHGSFIPNHGLLHIAEAAYHLRDHDQIQFELIGDGPQKKQINEYIETNHLKNITLVDWLNTAELTEKIAYADILLGTFGITPQAMMTIQNKIWEGLAMAKPIINGDSPAIQGVLTHGTHIYLCERENAKALADSILSLVNNPDLQKRISNEGSIYYWEHFSKEKIGELLHQHLNELLN